jgi:polar amino acid transport system substrate-binding protein
MRNAFLTLVALGAMACGLPRDSNGTLERVRGHVLRAGVSPHPPWDSVTAGAVSGVEPRLVDELARGLGARAVFRVGTESELLEALERRDLDVVVAGLHDDSPWKGRVALTRPYHTDSTRGIRYVMATPLGENGWLVHVERFLAAREQSLDTTGTGGR